MLTAVRAMIGQARTTAAKSEPEAPAIRPLPISREIDTLTAIRLIDMAGLGAWSQDR
ncbi:MAG: hypothetical protein J0I79_07060 [Mesorhizobium sp.]|uniref:hypothetical protein n=1 Tax=Mesorhizobium sp. TaxID=1871066 RepID=UPI001AC07250|nr:hypothetical protein [Mesorhizobium sp.]MBN9217695.1 hypothetical protein [Mesorhizobium sp.]